MHIADFHALLNKDNYSYEYVNGRTVIHFGRGTGHIPLAKLQQFHQADIDNNFQQHGHDKPSNIKMAIKSLPDMVTFKNSGHVDLPQLETIGDHCIFKNEGCVNLRQIQLLSESTQFHNDGHLFLNELQHVSPEIQFKCTGLIVFPFHLRSQFKAAKVFSNKFMNAETFHELNAELFGTAHVYMQAQCNSTKKFRDTIHKRAIDFINSTQTVYNT
jgi:hypothetical protein